MSKKESYKKEKTAGKLEMPLDKENYKLLAIAFGLVVLGFIIMTGGGSDDPNVFSDKIFDFRRVTLGPMTALAGFVFAIYAIMKKPEVDKKKKK
ncbi:DUF3098 domain-containing protein [Alkalitalea saponilacus]|uniref:DUF3098 domain-containing protein n=1 Tax=Alkalitalea saponilacus TaxID=889453 RepID=A0A1T5E6D4_9BACT|nr:DUF3098 domain-containing protein [Alkalitalea saponilacus]ASB49097.1 hypothetical protein CDL62_08070 [Alkalitalea saponilacus]SKB79406.1 Protein of unknown function [Alkalitalea saponilacus]